MRTCGLATVLLIGATIASSQTKSRPLRLNGTWEGTGYQIDDKSTWTMVLKARGRSFAIDYPSLSCGGRWRPISIGAARARFVEKLDRGQDKCANNGIMTIQRVNRNQVIFWWSYAGDTEVTASGVLTRKRPG